jgi:hypothetical protein
MKTLHWTEETWLDQGKDGETNTLEEEQALKVLHLAAAAAADNDTPFGCH